MPLPPTDHRLHADDAPVLPTAAARAIRALPDGALVLCGAAGLGTAALVAILRPDLWPLALPALTLASAGGWGVADRVVGESGDHVAARPALMRAARAIRFAAAALGVLSLTGTLLVLVGMTLVRTGGGWF